MDSDLNDREQKGEKNDPGRNSVHDKFILTELFHLIGLPIAKKADNKKIL